MYVLELESGDEGGAPATGSDVGTEAQADDWLDELLDSLDVPPLSPE